LGAIAQRKQIQQGCIFKRDSPQKKSKPNHTYSTYLLITHQKYHFRAIGWQIRMPYL